MIKPINNELIKEAVKRQLAKGLREAVKVVKKDPEPDILATMLKTTGAGALGGGVAGTVFGGDPIAGAKTGALVGAGAGALRHAVGKELLSRGVKTGKWMQKAAPHIRKGTAFATHPLLLATAIAPYATSQAAQQRRLNVQYGIKPQSLPFLG